MLVPLDTNSLVHEDQKFSLSHPCSRDGEKFALHDAESMEKHLLRDLRHCECH